MTTMGKCGAGVGNGGRVREAGFPRKSRQETLCRKDWPRDTLYVGHVYMHVHIHAEAGDIRRWCSLGDVPLFLKIGSFISLEPSKKARLIGQWTLASVSTVLPLQPCTWLSKMCILGVNFILWIGPLLIEPSPQTKRDWRSKSTSVQAWFSNTEKFPFSSFLCLQLPSFPNSKREGQQAHWLQKAVFCTFLQRAHSKALFSTLSPESQLQLSRQWAGGLVCFPATFSCVVFEAASPGTVPNPWFFWSHLCAHMQIP